MGEMQLPTIVEQGGFGGAGAGMGLLGGLILGSLWGGNGWGGWGGNRGAGQAAADATLANSIQNVGNQVQGAALSQLQSANQIGLQVANSAAGVTAGITQNTIANMQGDAAIGQQICCATGRLSQEIDNTGDQTVGAINAANIQSMQNTQQLSNGMSNLGQAITSQGYESRLQAQSLAAQLQSQHAALSAQIASENCADRELMREIAAQNVRDKLAEVQGENAALKAQINLSGQLQAQTMYLIDQLKTTTTAAAGA